MGSYTCTEAVAAIICQRHFPFASIIRLNLFQCIGAYGAGRLAADRGRCEENRIQI